MGTVTTKEHCAVKDGKAYTGSKANIVHEIFSFKFDNNRRLWYAAIGYKMEGSISYGDSFTDEEMRKDVIQVLFKKLPSYGYKLYRDVGF